MAVRGALEGGVTGATSMAATGNPWLIGAGFLGGAALGHFGEESDRPRERMIGEINRLQLQSLRTQGKMSALELKAAQRGEGQRITQDRKKRIIGRQLGRYFANVR